MQDCSQVSVINHQGRTCYHAEEGSERKESGTRNESAISFYCLGGAYEVSQWECQICHQPRCTLRKRRLLDMGKLRSRRTKSSQSGTAVRRESKLELRLRTLLGRRSHLLVVEALASSS